MELQLRRLRRSERMTQEELGAKVGQSARVIGSWERGESAMPIDDAARIADVLECSLDELAGREFHPVGESSLTSDEQTLIGLYRDTDERGQSTVMRAAEGAVEDFARGDATKTQIHASGVA